MSRRGLGQTYRPSTREELLAPYRTLALRVISIAVRDLINPGLSASERENARAFLSGSHMLTHWCGLADIDPAAIRRQMQSFAEDGAALRLRKKH